MLLWKYLGIPNTQTHSMKREVLFFFFFFECLFACPKIRPSINLNHYLEKGILSDMRFTLEKRIHKIDNFRSKSK